jgi:hypothetical protein
MLTISVLHGSAVGRIHFVGRLMGGLPCAPRCCPGAVEEDIGQITGLF